MQKLAKTEELLKHRRIQIVVTISHRAMNFSFMVQWWRQFSFVRSHGFQEFLKSDLNSNSANSKFLDPDSDSDTVKRNCHVHSSVINTFWVQTWTELIKSYFIFLYKSNSCSNICYTFDSLLCFMTNFLFDIFSSSHIPLVIRKL